MEKPLSAITSQLVWIALTLKLVLSKNLNNPLVLSNRGAARTELGKYDLAMLDINKSIEIYPENSFAFKNRAKLYLKLNDS
ncbi:MAG: hypothetical protein AB8F74_21195 [Saprospiraceae bacterium]